MLTGAINSAMSGIKVAQKVIDMSSNNIANVDTPGYKRLENKNFEIPAVPGVVGTGIGVNTSIESNTDRFADTKMAEAEEMLAEKVTLKDTIDNVAQVLKDSKVSESYTEMINAARALALDKNNPALKAAFNGAGKQFVRDANRTEEQLNTITADLQSKLSVNDEQIKALQAQLANITANAPTDSTPASVNALKQQLRILTGTANGYRKALSEVIPPVTAAYTSAMGTTKADINAKFGQVVINNNTWTNVTGNYDSLADSDIEDTGKRFSEVQTKAAYSSVEQRNELLYATDDYNYAKTIYNEQYAVDITHETMRVMNYQKMYEANAKVLQVADQMLGKLIDILA